MADLKRTGADAAGVSPSAREAVTKRRLFWKHLRGPGFQERSLYEVGEVGFKQCDGELSSTHALAGRGHPSSRAGEAGVGGHLVLRHHRCRRPLMVPSPDWR